MGEFELGCLLGQYDGTQSFTSQGSWDQKFIGGLGGEVIIETTETHSSQSNMALYEHGGNGGISWEYNYYTNNDYLLKRYSDITTHSVVAYSWSRMDTAAESGKIYIGCPDAGSNRYDIPFSNALNRHRQEGYVSTNSFSCLIGVGTAITDSCTIYVDDILTAVDWINIYPERSASENYALSKSTHTSLVGKRSTYIWHKSGAWELPIRYMPNSTAQLVNWWWEKNFNLLFTWNSSDTSQTFVTRLVNQGRPFQQLERPYNNEWQGTLQLEAVTLGLEF